MQNTLIITLGFLGFMSGIQAMDVAAGVAVEVDTPIKGNVSPVDEAATPDMVTVPLESPREASRQMGADEFVRQFFAGTVSGDEIACAFMQIDLWGKLFLGEMRIAFEAARTLESWRGYDIYSAPAGKWYCTVLVHMTPHLELGVVTDYASVLPPETKKYFLGKLELYCRKSIESALAQPVNWRSKLKLRSLFGSLEKSIQAYSLVGGEECVEKSIRLDNSLAALKARLEPPRT
ncbi:MAG: hypothetical protein QG632_548 [Candidatus Dependentiae bacterium]|nr:hypothetical protein [Candidatus Dependentiae bacterium]